MPAGDSSTSLQDAFRSFRQRKKLQDKGKKRSHQQDSIDQVWTLPATDPVRKQHLRALFVETAKKYIGVPYGRKHHEPEGCQCEGCVQAGRQLHGSPLFLDCCGLVRKVVRELQPLLGFRLGRGNQSYQFDTLPLRQDSILRLEPGDLVFYSGEYLMPGSKRHAFDMTHVEIFVGGSTGEATIGSRERQKWVMEYDSYAFLSKRWRLLSYHFVKIDTWLEGVCEPAHPELWRGDGSRCKGGLPGPALLRWDSSKYSVFNGSDDGDGEDASDGED